MEFEHNQDPNMT